MVCAVIPQMTLNGLQLALGNNIKLVTYYDEFIIIGKDKETLQSKITLIKSFLQEKGLTVSKHLTIVNIEQGFNFLNYNFREYKDINRAKYYKKGIFLIKPSKYDICSLKEHLRNTIKTYTNIKTYLLISKLNTILKQWAELHKAVTSKKIFSAIGFYVWQILWNLIVKKHKGVPKRELKHKYFKSVDGNNWVFFGKNQDGNDITLFQISWIPIKRHSLCLDKNPFLTENLIYYEKRVELNAKTSVMLNKNQTKLLNKQKGLCPVCEQPLLDYTMLEVHHVKPRKLGGTDSLRNLLLLHKLCHHQITYSKNPELRASWLQKKIIFK